MSVNPELDWQEDGVIVTRFEHLHKDRVGGTKPIKVNIRIIATSNRDLTEAVSEGIFREDLLYRLNVVNLRIPSLRERPADIRLLASHFIEKYSTANSIQLRQLSESAEQTILGHTWKGNVRELENTMHRSVLLAQGDQITEEAILLPDGSRVDEPMVSIAHDPVTQATMAAQSVSRSMVGKTVAEVERDLILETLNHCLGKKVIAGQN